MPEPLQLAAIAAAAGLVAGITGFGSGLVLMGVLVAIMPVTDAAVIAALTALACSILNLWTVRLSMPWRETWPMVAVSIPAVAVGVYLLASLSPGVLRILVAMMILSGCAVTLWTPPQGIIGPGLGWALLAGALGGLTGGATSTGGPPVVLYTLLRGWDKGIAKAVMSAFFVVMGVWRLALLIASGLASPESLRLGVWLLVPMLSALYVGMWIFRRLSTQVFRYAAMALLGITAINLLIS
ncbi:MAG TPA: sulfite exporter TauE/SafE family protein [Chloroflexi bacterium]|nr:sulfite exporter TauE/SafE family protein [Chloroflexota bacterium]